MRKILPIVHLTAQFAEIKRTVGYKKGHLENDAEHSFQLALACWMANEQYMFGFSDELILKFALVHDLVEIYAGDTDAHADKDTLASKKDREARAFETLKQEYGQFADMLGAIERYENKQDEEAQLVYILDKFIADRNIFVSQEPYYLERKVDIAAWKAWVFRKIDIATLSPKMKSLVDECMNEIETNYSNMFYTASK